MTVGIGPRVACPCMARRGAARAGLACVRAAHATSSLHRQVGTHRAG